MSYSPRGFIEPILLKNSGMITRPSAFSRRNKNSSCTCSFLLTQMPRGIWTRIKSLHCRHRKNKELKRITTKDHTLEAGFRLILQTWLRCDLPIFQIIHLGVNAEAEQIDSVNDRRRLES